MQGGRETVRRRKFESSRRACARRLESTQVVVTATRQHPAGAEPPGLPGGRDPSPECPWEALGGPLAA